MLGESIRGELLRAHTNYTWLSLYVDSLMLHGKLAIAGELAVYSFLCWIAFRFIHRSKGRERLFYVGWFAGYVAPPIKTLRPEWAVPLRHIETLGFLLSFVIALSLLLYPLNSVGSNDRA